MISLIQCLNECFDIFPVIITETTDWCHHSTSIISVISQKFNLFDFSSLEVVPCDRVCCFRSVTNEIVDSLGLDDFKHFFFGCV